MIIFYVFVTILFLIGASHIIFNTDHAEYFGLFDSFIY